MAEQTSQMEFVIKYLTDTGRAETLQVLGVPGLPDQTDASDDSILHPKARHSHPNDVFEPNDTEIAIIENELPACDDSTSQTSSQLFQKLLDDDSLEIPEFNSESVSEPGPAPQERAWMSLKEK